MSQASSDSNDIIRVRSDYIGAGHYLVCEDDNKLVVNTDYGIQAVGFGSHEHWQCDLGERTLGLCMRADGTIVANTLHAIYQVTPEGDVRHVNPTLTEIAHAPVPWEDGVLIATLSHLYALDDAGKVRWKFAFKDALGESVRACLVLSLFPARGGVVVGVVDYNSGLGRVLSLDASGALRAQGEVAPLTYVFPVGDDRCIYSISGYGRFESHCINLDAKPLFSLDFGGAGTTLPDGRIALLTGNNESPTWDNWELRVLSAEGDVVDQRKARGHYGFGPVLGPDNHLYQVGYFKPFDPSATRLDYTSLVPLPKFLTFDQLMGVKAQPHQFLVYYFRAPLDGGEMELVFDDRNSIAFGPVVAARDHVFCTHNRDILAIPVRT